MKKVLSAGIFLSFAIYILALQGCSNPANVMPAGFSASGEFATRMSMAEERLTGDNFEPLFTAEFILADVNLNPDNPRRFQEYSGDISGRYVEVISASGNPEYDEKLNEIVKQIISFQKPDGRFGDPDLVFSEEQINSDHMPLLWGNGRLLVGLLEYYRKTGNRELLDAAVRLGDFFTGCYREVTPAVVKRLEGLGADGIICFTQYVEPLVMLSEITGDKKYAEVASRVYPVLPARGTLHSHGYLTTLRGVLNLYESVKDPLHLEFVQEAYNELVNSDDLTIYGSVKEYFGGKGDRDEGCSTSDFIRLSLHLFKLTGSVSYLEKAEFAMYNSLYFNQYFTGDFGHHTIDNTGSPSELMMAAWWCCTMSGLRALQVIKNDYFIVNNEGEVEINLFLEAGYSDENISLSLRKKNYADGYHNYELLVRQASGIISPLMVRNPSWADDIKILINGKNADQVQEGDYISVREKIENGDRITIRLMYKTGITAGVKELQLSEIKAPLGGILRYGPRIMAIDSKTGYTFLAEPNNNTVYANTIINSTAGDNYLSAMYKHDGYPSRSRVLFRPVSEMTFDGHPYMMVSFKFAPENHSK